MKIWKGGFAMDKQTLGMLIKEKRKEKKITQKQLALQLNVTETAVSKWQVVCGDFK